MAKVPIYDAPQVETRALPDVRQSSVASPELFSAAAKQQGKLGEAALSTGSVGFAIAGRLQAEENEALIKGADTEYSTTLHTLLNDPTNGYRTKLGKNAVDLREHVVAEVGKADTEIVKRFTNDRQRQLWAQVAGKRKLAAITDVDSHALTQTHNWKLTESQARADALQRDMVSNWANDERMDEYKRGLLGEVAAQAELQGLDEAGRGVLASKYLTAAHTDTIKQMVSLGLAGKAKAYFEKNVTEIDSRKHEDLRRYLEEGGLAEVAQGAVDGIFSRGLPESEARAHIHKNFSGKQEREVLKEYDYRLSKQHSTAADAAWKSVVADQPVGPDVWASLSGQDQRHITDYRNAGGADNYEYIDKVENLIISGEITKTGDLEKYHPFFSKTTMRTLRTMLQKQGVVSLKEMKDAFEERKGLKIKPDMGESNRQEWMGFQKFVTESVGETNRKQDLDSLADQWFKSGSGRNDSWYINDPSTFGEAYTKGRKDFAIKPPAEAEGTLNDALRILRQNGVKDAPTDAAGRAEFYTKYRVEAERWFTARRVQPGAKGVAAYAILRASNKPITAANIEHLMGKMSKD